MARVQRFEHCHAGSLDAASSWSNSRPKAKDAMSASDTELGEPCFFMM
jgi:hypothetical protein